MCKPLCHVRQPQTSKHTKTAVKENLSFTENSVTKKNKKLGIHCLFVCQCDFTQCRHRDRFQSGRDILDDATISIMERKAVLFVLLSDRNSLQNGQMSNNYVRGVSDVIVFVEFFDVPVEFFGFQALRPEIVQFLVDLPRLRCEAVELPLKIVHALGFLLG